MHPAIVKILNVKDNNNLRITETDKAFCELTQQYFNETIANLDRWEKLFKASLDEDFKDRYSARLNYNDKMRYSNNAKYENEILEHMFFPGAALEEIEDNRPKAATEFVSAIIRHFNDTYNIGLSLREMDEPEQVTKYEEVVDWIFAHIDGGSLSEHGIRNLIKNFREAASAYGSKVTQTRNRIEFSRARSMFDTYTSGPQFSVYDKQYQHFMYGLGYFDSSKLEHMPASDMASGQKVIFNHNYTFSNSEKLVSIKFYKSNKVILTFRSDGDAIAFFGSFELG